MITAARRQRSDFIQLKFARDFFDDLRADGPLLVGKGIHQRVFTEQIGRGERPANTDARYPWRAY